MSALLIYPDSEETRERAAKVVAAGGIVAFRTDTCSGLGADPFNVEALEALNELKGRDGKPILGLVIGSGALQTAFDRPRRERRTHAPHTRRRRDARRDRGDFEVNQRASCMTCQRRNRKTVQEHTRNNKKKNTLTKKRA